MAHDIFISHSAKDKKAADMACAVLERNGLRCWIAPRDIPAGADWPTAIIAAIQASRAMVLVFSADANTSDYVKREVSLAVERGIAVLPVRIEEVVPTDGMKFFLTNSHWMDAITPPLENHLLTLAKTLRVMLKMPEQAIAPPVDLPPDDWVSSPRGSDAGNRRPDAGNGGTRMALGVFLILIALAAFGGWWVWKQMHKAALALAPKMEAATQPAVPLPNVPSTASTATKPALIVTAASKPATVGKEFTNSLGMDFVRIEPGRFTMGSPETEEGRQPNEKQHTRIIGKAFYMGTTTVTQKQWLAVMGNNPSGFSRDDLPVDSVSWDDAMALIGKLNALEKEKGRHYRLPSEGEWEYACRAGTTTPFNFGATISTDQANYDGTATYGAGVKGEDRQMTVPAKSFQPNPWGLYQMHGNVWQWCATDYKADYVDGEITDPQNEEQNNATARRVLRGGSWYNFPRNCRSASRRDGAPGGRYGIIGFRVVLDFQ